MSDQPTTKGYLGAWLCTLFLFCASLNAVAADWTYSVRPGDDLWRLAAKYCGSTAYAQRLAKHNQLSRPQDLRAGTRLNIPVAWLVRQPAEVEVKSVTGTVTDQDGKPFAPGDRILMGTRLLTEEGIAVVIFADGSSLEIGKHSEVLFNILTAYGDTGMVDTHLRFYKGRGAARVIKRKTASKFRIWTPSGIAAVRGTDFRVGTLAQPGTVESNATTLATAAAARVETVTGAVEYQGGAQNVALPAGFGVVASTAGANKEELLPAPVVADTQRALWQPDDVVRWQPDSRAQEYRLNLYQQSPEGWLPVRSLAQQSAEYSLAGVSAGNYELAVRAVAMSGLEGFDTRFPLSMGASAPVVTSSAAAVQLGALSWSVPEGHSAVGYEVEISGDPEFSDPGRYSVETEQLDLDETVAAQPGAYFWRVRRQDSAFSEAQRIEIPPARVSAVEVDRQPRAEGARNQTLALRWPTQPGETYNLAVSALRANAGTAPYRQDALAAGNHQTPALAPGRYRIELTAVAGGVSGETQTRTVRVREPEPWWPPLLIFTPLLFLL